MYSDARKVLPALAKPQELVETAVRIAKTKTKRLKQHSRRAGSQKKAECAAETVGIPNLPLGYMARQLVVTAFDIEFGSQAPG